MTKGFDVLYDDTDMLLCNSHSMYCRDFTEKSLEKVASVITLTYDIPEPLQPREYLLCNSKLLQKLNVCNSMHIVLWFLTK
jgi:hypothetical protein